MPQHRKKDESERLGGKRDQIKVIDLRFERWQAVGLSELCGERPWWSIQSLDIGNKKKVKC